MTSILVMATGAHMPKDLYDYLSIGENEVAFCSGCEVSPLHLEYTRNVRWNSSRHHVYHETTGVNPSSSNGN